MALSEDTKELIRAVATNNTKRAKETVKRIVAKETAEKNRYFCKSIYSILETESKNIEVPQKLQGILKMEDTLDFNENRYFLSEREEDLFRHICMAKNTNEKLNEMGIRYINSTLLYGESGTGKTTFGRYIAHKLGLPFAYLSFSYCIDSHLGQTSKNIEEVFNFIANQKCVLMLDEVDAIGTKRGLDDLGEMARVTIGLMQAFDMLRNDIIVIGATNRKDIIDDALLRRFTMQHEVKTLNQYEVISLIEMFLRDLEVQYDKANIVEYAKTHNKQSKIINDITKAIVRMLNEDTKFIL